MFGSNFQQVETNSDLIWITKVTKLQEVEMKVSYWWKWEHLYTNHAAFLHFLLFRCLVQIILNARGVRRRPFSRWSGRTGSWICWCYFSHQLSKQGIVNQIAFAFKVYVLLSWICKALLLNNYHQKTSMNIFQFTTHSHESPKIH